MRADVLYLIWLQESLGYGSCHLKNILDYKYNLEDFYKKGEKEWISLGCFTEREINSLRKYKLEDAIKIIDKSKSLKYDIIGLNDERYPQRLRNIDNPPGVLYVDGELPNIDNSLSIAIVGTRSATKYGVDVAFDFGYNLAKADVVVVSGGALGVDCSAQKGALAGNGKVISVLGCGINHKYLMENKTLRDTIAKNGAVISEYPPDTKANRWHFPIRNRIISGLSLGTLVVEAGKKSGSLITADLCLEQNRDLYAVPGSLNSSVSVGTNNLIKECAKPVTSIKDILEEYENLYPYLIEAETENKKEINTYNEDKTEIFKKNISELSSKAQKLYNTLDGVPLNINDIAMKSGMEIPAILQAITELEIYELIENTGGRMYCRKNKL